MTSQPDRTDNSSPVATTRPAPASDKPTAGNTAPPRIPQHKITRTRISGSWAAAICFAVVLLLLLIFILQNSRTVEVSYFGAHGHLSLGVAMLLAAVAGVLLVALPGTARIIQLRITARRHRRADTRRLAGRQPRDGGGSAGPDPQAAPTDDRGHSN